MRNPIHQLFIQIQHVFFPDWISHFSRGFLGRLNGLVLMVLELNWRAVIFLHRHISRSSIVSWPQNCNCSESRVISLGLRIHWTVRVIFLFIFNRKFLFQVHRFYCDERRTLYLFYLPVFFLSLCLQRHWLVFFSHFCVVWKKITFYEEVILKWRKVLDIGFWVGIKWFLIGRIRLVFLVLQEFNFIEI